MSTRSSINVKVGNKIHSVYCHWDGYPTGNGKMLLEHYNSQALAEKVVSLGSISFLGESMDKPEFSTHSFNNPVEGISVVYSRDRGDTETKPIVSRSMKNAMEKIEQVYNYFWDGEKWLVFEDDFSNAKEVKTVLEKHARKIARKTARKTAKKLDITH